MIAPPQTKPVPERHRFETDALARWLRETVDTRAETIEVRQFEGGQSNPTFWVSDGQSEWVLRKKPPGVLLPSAHQVEREYRVMRALRTTEVPVAEVYGLCEDASIVGTPFFLMEMLRGRIFWDVRLADLATAERSAIYEELVSVLASIHRVDLDATDLGNFGKPSGYLARQVRRWTGQYNKSATGAVPAMDALIAWLPANLPADLPEGDETTLAHGDFRLDNLVFAPDEPRCIGVIDWELATLGHPLADLAYSAMLYDVRMPRLGGLAGVDFERSGIPDEPAFVTRYLELTGRDIPAAWPPADWPFFKAFSLFRFAAIVQGVYRRSLDGNASSDEAAMFGAVVAQFAKIGCQLAGVAH